MAEQVAPLLAVWLRYEQREAELAASAAREAELAQRLRATDALRLRAMLVAGAAHDIGNLFTTMMGYSQLLQQDLPPAFQNDLQMIVRAVEDGRQLLRRLQGSETAPRALASAATAGQVIQEVVQLTRPLWERRTGVTVEMVLETDARVRVPAEDLREVLVNLIMNAVAALSEGGTITVRSRTAGNVVAISVTDTGHGIAREHQGAIFQPFVTTRSEGSGLGLSVSRALIERHGGTLTVESEPGHGATFTIFLPVAS
jgi:signal transduction histidine kinase